MDKVFTFLMITATISLFLFLAGLGGDLNFFSIINNIITGGDFINSNALWTKIAGATIFIALAAGVTYQSVIAGNASAAITGVQIVMAGYLVTFITDLIAVLSKANQVCEANPSGLCGVGYYVIAIPITLLAIGFSWSLAEYVLGGGD